MNPLLLDLPSSFESERLTLRMPQRGDGQALFEAVSESLVELRRFLVSLPWVAADPSPEASEVFCRNAFANFHARKDFPFLLHEKTTGKLVGVCGLHRPEWTVPKIEIGYWCRTSSVGHGFVSEAVMAVTGYAFTHMEALRAEIVTDDENTASRRVAERAGFALEGTLRNDRRALDGSLRNTCIYARLR